MPLTSPGGIEKQGSGTIAALNGIFAVQIPYSAATTFTVTGTWVATLVAEVSVDDTTWVTTPFFVPSVESTTTAIATNNTISVPVGSYSQVRLRAAAYSSGTINVTYNTDGEGNVELATIVGAGTVNNQLMTHDVLFTAGQNRAQSVTTTAAEALGASTILTSRKSLTITPTNGVVYWGYANTVTTTTGVPIFKNQTVTFSAAETIHVYLISAGTVDCRVTEAG